MTTDDPFLSLRPAGARFDATRPAIVEGAPWPLAERIDDAPEAEWGPPEVLAHVAEMVPYWQGEIERVIAGTAAGASVPVPFGRVATDAMRLGVLERDRSLPPTELYDRIASSVGRLERRLSALTPAERADVGLHPRLGEMTVEAMAVRFVISHLAEHAVQLEAILGLGPMES